MGFWETVGATALGVPLAALVVWLANIGWRKFRTERSAMTMTRMSATHWTVKLTGRRTFFNAMYYATHADGTGITPSLIQLTMVADLLPDAPGYCETEDGGSVQFMWIDRVRRSATVKIRSGVEEINVVPDPLPRRRLKWSV